ncbi:hypothetical protein ACGGAQ_32075 [Micromonospora sp. NPDC047557]|uniref:hypothetical protein n=1 Tax=Micromonospora sp. NPDC047557 TaxID=3364250 RepID=UPI0037172046
MDAAATGALVVAAASLLVSVLGIRYSRVQAVAARHAVEHAERVRREQTQPYVFADLRSDEHQPQLLVLLVRNQGPTVARNVRVTVEPPLEDVRSELVSEWFISAIAPGAQLARPIAVAWNLFERAADELVHQVAISGEGPDGAIEPLKYEINLKSLEHVSAYQKTVYHAVKALEKIAKNTEPKSQAAGLSWRPAGSDGRPVRVDGDQDRDDQRPATNP